MSGINPGLSPGGEDALTDAELRASDVGVSDAVSQSKLDTLNNTLGTPRQEDGHGSSSSNATHVDPARVVSQVDYFNLPLMGSPYNQVEARLDASDYADFVTSSTDGISGAVAQTDGLVQVATGTSATADASIITVDAVEYRPGIGIYGGATAIMTAGVSNSYQRVGITTDTSYTDSVTIGYEGTSFGIRYTRAGSEILFTAQADWNIDPCQSAATSKYKVNGSVATLDPNKPQIYRVLCGLFGMGGWLVQVWSPGTLGGSDRGWINVHEYQHVNSSTDQPVFSSNDFKVISEAKKTGAGSTNLKIRSQCFAAGTSMPHRRLGGTMTARDLVEFVRTGHIVQSDISQSPVADQQYDTPSLTRFRELRTSNQVSKTIQDCNDATDFTAFDTDTANLADSTNHVFGTGAVTFDKANTGADSTYAGASFTLDMNISELFEDGGFASYGVYLPSLSNVEAVGIRLGTDASNYNEWETPADDLESGKWLQIRSSTAQPTASVGNGWDTSNIDYGAIFVRFGAQSNTLAGIIFDNVHLVRGSVTDTSFDASITTSISSNRVDMFKVGGTTVDTNTGNASAGTQRVVLATNQPDVPVRHTDGTYDANIGALTTATGVATASGDTTIVSVSGGNKILVYALSFVPTTSSIVDRDVIIKTGTTDRVQWRTVTAGGGYAESYKNDQWIEGADGEDLVINLSGVDSIAYNIKYKIVSA